MVRIGKDEEDTSSTSTDEEEFISSITPKVAKKSIVIQRWENNDTFENAMNGMIEEFTVTYAKTRCCSK